MRTKNGKESAYQYLLFENLYIIGIFFKTMILEYLTQAILMERIYEGRTWTHLDYVA